MNGCHNRDPYVEAILMQDGWVIREIDEQTVALPKMVKVKHNMSKECNYRHTDLGKQDKGCTGCSWREK